ncbi:hypothetical protein OIU78_018090 [Salix suchowensis]|nr:hypothetical protein OIU78_018090 [Salix suchowensis]
MARTGDNVVVSSMKLEKLLCMKGGKGEGSYASNSQAQALHARSMLHLLEETLDRVHLHSPEFPFQLEFPAPFTGGFFPARSIDVFHSAFSLHWLSQVPECVLDKRSAAYNKGRVFIHDASESTTNAYRKQFQADLAGFLSARSQEMKSGGSMFLVCLGRTSADPTDQGGAGHLFGTHFQDAWDDLVQEVIISFHQKTLQIFCVRVFIHSAFERQENTMQQGV